MMKGGKFNIGKRLLAPIMIAALITLTACTSAAPTTITPEPSPTLDVTSGTSQPPSISAAPEVSSGTSPASATDFITAAEKLTPSVVIIEVEMVTQDLSGQPSVQPAAGSGWVVGANGLIATNNHVVDGAQSITITLADGRKLDAVSVKGNADKDLAVIKIDAQNLPVASIGDSSQLKMGQPVATIGNALDLGVRVTAGVVSLLDVSITLSTNQTMSGLIETDAAINPGNSGGVLVNMSGEVVGITNAGLEGSNVELFGYAIPVNDAMPVINQLISQIP
jgi:serine protease Do